MLFRHISMEIRTIPLRTLTCPYRIAGTIAVAQIGRGAPAGYPVNEIMAYSARWRTSGRRPGPTPGQARINPDKWTPAATTLLVVTVNAVLWGAAILALYYLI
jgi:hypothetical protein